MSPLNIVLILSACSLGLVLIATHRAGLASLSFFIGASAGLILVQVNGMHVFTILVLTYVLLSNTNRSRILVRVVVLVLASALLAITAWIGDLTTTTGLGLQLLALSISTALYVQRVDPRHLLQARTGLLTFTVAGAVTAIGQAVGVVPQQLFQLEGAEAHRPSGFYPEPDWLGLYSAVGLVLACTSPMKRRGWQALLIVVLALGVLLASARAAILALLVVALWNLLTSARDRRRAGGEKSQVAFLAMIGLAGSVAVATFFPEQIDLLIHRTSAALGGVDNVAIARYGQISGMQELFYSAPWYGHGLSASGRVNGFGVIYYGDGISGSAGSNWFFSLLADGKVLAVPVIAVLCFYALFGNRRTGASLLLLVLVNSLFSNALFFPLTWFAIALAMFPRTDLGIADARILDGKFAAPTFRESPLSSSV